MSTSSASRYSFVGDDTKTELPVGCEERVLADLAVLEYELQVCGFGAARIVVRHEKV